MLTVRHHVAKSRIEGVGLFCTEKIRKGQTIFRYDPRWVLRISDAEIDALPDAMREAVLKYSYRGVGKDRLTDAVYYCIDDSRFMNHSPTPNTIWILASETYVAAHDIDSGTELTCDYADFCEPGDGCFRLSDDGLIELIPTTAPDPAANPVVFVIPQPRSECP